MANLGRWCSLLCACSLAACGGQSLNDGGDGGGSGGAAVAGTSQGGSEKGGSGDGGSDSAGTEAGGSNVGGTGAGGTGPSNDPACFAYDDQAPIPVHLRMLNKTERKLYLGQTMNSCVVEPLFDVQGQKLGVLPALSACRTSCQSLRTQGEGIGCPAICTQPESFTLEPGEAHELMWDGLYLSHDGAIPSTCTPYDNDRPLRCDQAKRIEPDLFTFSATAGATVECAQSAGPDGCGACVPDAGGGCLTKGMLIGGKMIYAQARLTIDESYGLYSDAADAAPGAGAAPGALNEAYIELVFDE